MEKPLPNTSQVLRQRIFKAKQDRDNAPTQKTREWIDRQIAMMDFQAHLLEANEKRKEAKHD